ARLGTRLELSGVDCRLRLAERQPGGLPGSQSAVEQVEAVTLAQPGEYPPGPCGKGIAVVVVEHHCAVIVDTQLAQAVLQPLRGWQGMAAGLPRTMSGAELTTDVDEACLGNMPGAIAAQAVVGIVQGKAAVQQDQLRVVQQVVEGERIDQAGKRHDTLQTGKCPNHKRF